MKYIIVLIAVISPKALAECAQNTNLGATMAEGIKSHPERYESYILEREPLETKSTSIGKKYGVNAKKEKIPELIGETKKTRACVTEYEFQFKNKDGAQVMAHCLVSSRLHENETMAYNVRYCEKGTEDKVLAKKLNFNID